MPHPTTRVLAMLEILQSAPGITGARLAARLGVDERTVRRYARVLGDVGVPVTADRGRHGGYRLLPGYRMPPLVLTDDEATAVVLGLLAARRLALTTEGAGGESALAKIDRVLPATLRERTRALAAALDFTRDPVVRDTAPSSAIVLTLADGARRRRTTRVEYVSWRGDTTERDLDPHGIVFHSGRWYVTGHDHLRGEVRTFRVDRVRAARPTDRTFPDPGDVDPVARVTAGLAAVEYAWRVDVWLDADPADVRRRVPPTLGEVAADAEGGTTLRFRTERLDGAARMLAGFEWPFRVREPDELRTAVADLAARLRAAAEA